ncbi:hypothetical protein [Sphaerotilus natans]|jgi:hypothetical protein|nr:hypothetical protein [Sphaerotilus natans]
MDTPQPSSPVAAPGESAALRRDLAYSHILQGWPELLDPIWVSEEWVGSSRCCG